jgi:hypothetical protein
MTEDPKAKPEQPEKPPADNALEQSPPPLSRTWDLFTGGAVVTVVGAAFGLGLLIGEKGSKQELAAQQATCERTLATEEDKTRQCERLASSLQAALGLEKADRDRLLESMTVEPTVKLSYEGRALAGQIAASPKHAGPNDFCWTLPIWLENTGSRDVDTAGAEVLTSTALRGEQNGQVLTEQGREVYRHWVDIYDSLPPGARRFAEWHFCQTAAPADGGTEVVDAALVLFSRGNLPLRKSFTVSIPPFRLR